MKATLSKTVKVLMDAGINHSNGITDGFAIHNHRHMGYITVSAKSNFRDVRADLNTKIRTALIDAGFTVQDGDGQFILKTK